ncbi:MAG: DUF1622 domain-containing protein [Oscillospiraceae bacterium]|nr:DUF1622 domain-containing protein [Oscillospiraceae bacterium]
MDLLETILGYVVQASILLFEFLGVGVLVASGLYGIWCYLKKDPLTRLKLAKGMAMGLEFKLGSEILRTVVVREFKEIAIVGCIILLRAGLTFLIHWEIKSEEKVQAKEEAAPEASVQKTSK